MRGRAPCAARTAERSATVHAPTQQPLAITLPPPLRDVLASGPVFASAFLVGGCVRDALLGAAGGDFDVEVHGVSLETLVEALGHFGRTDVVGRAFGVVKLALPGVGEVDFSIPRRDSKMGTGHRGFAVESDPGLSPREATARRDFTANALLWDPRLGVVIDHWGGIADLHARVLRHTSEAFDEDPLRVLRAMQFVSRFDFTVATETVARCRAMRAGHAELPPDRVRAEWFKWAGRSVRPSAGLRFLEDCGWLAHYPELAALPGTPQDPGWHPEGDVWAHTLFALDALAGDPAWRHADEPSRIAWMLAVLLHDIGKPACTARARHGAGVRIVSPAHESEGARLAPGFLARIGAPGWTTDRVVPLVAQHMAHLQAASERAVRRLAKRLEPETIAGLAVIIRADMAGRPPLPPAPPAELLELLRLAESLRLSHEAPRRILLGRHLLELGRMPGPVIGRVLEQAFEAQLDGEFSDLPGALEWLGRFDGAPPRS
jgi:tRNA nucleotidyltransferase (CCA-adding enzyme)